mmetsp:Transcript_37061/g.59553  ORF Transcript_37061/g.59553 Transcript_37061/m.59553 type:complete len:139 (+) Transcript_37061:401-817(+)
MRTGCTSPRRCRSLKFGPILTRKNAVIFADNDFEIFVDVDGSTHGYKEFEVNARNTTWDLILNAPYGFDGGFENSSRVFGRGGWSMTPPLVSAVHVEEGRLNDPTAGETKRWTVEMALPVALLSFNTSAAAAAATDSH